MSNIRSLLKKSEQGLDIFGETKKIITNKLMALSGNKNSLNIIELLQMLSVLSLSKEYKIICKRKNSIENCSTYDKEKIDILYNYINKNFTKEISLDNAASLLNLSKSAFCHFFFKRTGKNFSKVINEMRIENTCKQLIETELSVAEICFLNGYNCLSNFNKQFKSITKTTPLKYKKFFKKYEQVPSGEELVLI